MCAIGWLKSRDSVSYTCIRSRVVDMGDRVSELSLVLLTPLKTIEWRASDRNSDDWDPRRVGLSAFERNMRLS